MVEPRVSRCLLYAFLLLLSLNVWSEERSNPRLPVKEIAADRIAVGEHALIPIYLSADWSHPQPMMTRAVVMLHGRLRNADVYFKSAQNARTAAGPNGKNTLLIAPQFLSTVDIKKHHLPREILRWSLEGWEGGEPALKPTKQSSFDALDAILLRLADRKLFPNLQQVIVAGHSGGAQVVQRYAIAGHGEAALADSKIQVRYVVANPSSYAYFSKDRPEPKIAASCSGFNEWKYGMEARPSYLSSASIASLEKTYVSRHVIYLLGAKDTDPNDHAMDTSCMAMSQGAFRYARGHAYTDMMKSRDGGTPNHLVLDVVNVGHDADKMFVSACGLHSLFDSPGCD